MTLIRVFSAVVLWVASGAAQEYMIYTYPAGAPAPSLWKPGGIGPSTLAGVALDREGNLFVTDTGNHRILKVSTSGIISTVAGNGTPGYEGNNGIATGAQLTNPLGVAVDGWGNLFIADTGNNYVRKVSSDGIITTIPGSDSDFGTFAVAVDGAGNLFIAGADRVRKISPNGTSTLVAGGGTLRDSSRDGSPATEAQLFYLCGVAVDAAGALFIADCNGGVHKISAEGIITRVPVPGANTTGVAVDRAGNLFVATADFDGWDITGGGERIYKVSPDGSVTAIAGRGSRGYSGDGGPAADAELAAPAGPAVDAAGNIYFADTGNGVVRVLRPSGF
jgi:trimeric autotransporter adhesin